MCARLWRELGLKDIRLEINSLGSAEARARYRTKLVSYLEQHAGELDADAQRRMHSNPLRVLDSKNPQMQALIGTAPKLADDLDQASAEAFAVLQSSLRAAGIEFSINPRLVRGLDYYNGTVFEWVTDRLGAQGTVCAGGRYDGLMEQVGGKPAPACGFAMGVERLLALMAESGVAIAEQVPDVYVLRQGEAAFSWGELVAEQLRDSGLSVVLHCGGGSFKSQMKKADGSGARYAVILGDDEVAAMMLSVKALRAQAGQQEQRRVTLPEACEIIKSR
jgi:histidyl-tRNA synthetase